MCTSAAALLIAWLVSCLLVCLLVCLLFAGPRGCCSFADHFAEVVSCLSIPLSVRLSVLLALHTSVFIGVMFLALSAI